MSIPLKSNFGFRPKYSWTPSAFSEANKILSTPHAYIGSWEPDHETTRVVVNNETLSGRASIASEVDDGRLGDGAMQSFPDILYQILLQRHSKIA